jgi:putative copper resistance protein D
MFIAGIVSEALLYSCFSLLLGSFILNLIPKYARPEIRIPKGVLLAAALGIALFSFLPVLRIVLYLYEDLGLGYTLKSVLTNFEVGKTWISTGFISLILFIYLIPIKLEQKPLFYLNRFPWLVKPCSILIQNSRFPHPHCSLFSDYNMGWNPDGGELVFTEP